MEYSCKQLTKKYNSVDLMKFVLSVFVMIIHSGVDKTLIAPLLRMAVPLFFIVSSYFFFNKNKKLTSKAEKKAALLHFVKRNLLLYAVWAGFQLPLVMFGRGYFDGLFPDGILSMLKDLLQGNAFTGSWYVVASVIGVLFIYWASQYLAAKWLVLITLPLYLFGCLVTNYWNLFEPDSFVVRFANGYHDLTGLHFNNSFPIALFWMSVGCFLTQIKVNIKSWVLWMAVLISGVLIALEQYLTVHNSLAVMDDCYVMLIPLCPAFFLLVSRWKVTVTSRFRLREISVLIYVMHGCCERVAGYGLKMLPLDPELRNAAKVMIALVMILALGHLLIYLREKRGVRLLKYAY